MKTIIQTIGPLYGDDANGTVFGQPNGSVYTPGANSIITELKLAKYIRNTANGGVAACTSTGDYTDAAVCVVQCQMPWVFNKQVATDSDFNSIVCSSDYLRQPPYKPGIVGNLGEDYTILDETTYYARVVVYTDVGRQKILTSDTVTLTGVVI